MENVLTEIWQNREQNPDKKQPARQSHLNFAPGEEKDADIFDNISSLHQLYADLPESQRFRQVAIDVVQFHMASQANMYAALSWALVRLLTEPASRLESSLAQLSSLTNQLRNKQMSLADMRVLEPDSTSHALGLDGLEVVGWTECVIQESLRLAQQSITLRKVMKPITFATEAGPVNVEPGVYLATLLSVTNVDALHLPPSVKSSSWDDYCPERYEYTEKDGSREKAIYDRAQVAREAKDKPLFNVSTFGHGFHSCPGQRFAMHVIKVSSSCSWLCSCTHPIPPPSWSSSSLSNYSNLLPNSSLAPFLRPLVSNCKFQFVARCCSCSSRLQSRRHRPIRHSMHGDILQTPSCIAIPNYTHTSNALVDLFTFLAICQHSIGPSRCIAIRGAGRGGE